uniref:4Fe-4S ferredoxin n=1 Tax=Elaeophora elaphi TaxID=1147741 RepID=A0A0R3S6Z4_9BILA
KFAEVIKQRLTYCEHKSKNICLITSEGCSNGLVQERIACINLLSYTCQFIKHDYTFRLVPARVIIQEARIIEDGAAKCVKVIRLIKKHNQPKLI